MLTCAPLVQTRILFAVAGDAAYQPDLGSGAAAASEGAGSSGRHGRRRRRGSLVSARQLNGGGSAADGGAAAAAGQHPLEDLEDGGPGAGVDDEDDLLLMAPQPRFTGSTQPRHGQSTASRCMPALRLTYWSSPMEQRAAAALLLNAARVQDLLSAAHLKLGLLECLDKVAVDLPPDRRQIISLISTS